MSSKVCCWVVRECVSPEESADWLLNLRMGPEGRSCATGGRVTGALLATLEAKLGARTHKGAILCFKFSAMAESCPLPPFFPWVVFKRSPGCL